MSGLVDRLSSRVRRHRGQLLPFDAPCSTLSRPVVTLSTVDGLPFDIESVSRLDLGLTDLVFGWGWARTLQRLIACDRARLARAALADFLARRAALKLSNRAARRAQRALNRLVRDADRALVDAGDVDAIARRDAATAANAQRLTDLAVQRESARVTRDNDARVALVDATAQANARIGLGLRRLAFRRDFTARLATRVTIALNFLGFVPPRAPWLGRRRCSDLIGWPRLLALRC